MVSAALSARGVREHLVHTGQHFDDEMSKVFFDELDMAPPEINLGISGGSHGEMTARMLVAIEATLQILRPDAVVIFGDTNSTLAAALAAAKLSIPIAHVESGLRSWNREMPEEINRLVADRLSTLLLAPTEQALANLVAEGVDQSSVVLTGDVMYDACLAFAARASERSTALKRLALAHGAFVLATVHRAENTDDPARLRAVFEALMAVSGEVPVVVPLHPRTSAALEAAGLAAAVRRKLLATQPLGYLDMTSLEAAARLIVTDSGGVQKEAFFHRVQCITVREETEWTELVELGWNRVVSPTSAVAVEGAIRQALGQPGVGREASPYGDGDASTKVAAAVARLLSA